ncbi:MAG: response regulator transcription factor [Deltaproteobacteria bacterium]|nr:response regulator transcription factor [Deltaproteobacteria bacterium]
MKRVLIVEDDVDVASLIDRGLRDEGLESQVVGTVSAALRQLADTWDLVILDLTLPDLPGDSVLRFLNQSLYRPPVLVLTARGEVETKLELFKQGCDDYLTKPFVLEELLARVRALLRRPLRVLSSVAQYQGLKLIDEHLQLAIGDEVVSLTPKEYAICRLLLEEPGRVISRKELLHSVWGFAQEPNTNFIEVHLAHLRKKLKPFDRDGWVQTVRNSGITLSRPS